MALRFHVFFSVISIVSMLMSQVRGGVFVVVDF